MKNAVHVVWSEVPVTGLTGMQARRRWSAEEEEALRRAVNLFGSGSWKEIKESEPALANRSTVQLKEKVFISVSLHKGVRESNCVYIYSRFLSKTTCPFVIIHKSPH
jgi:hypothetical protein